MFVNRSDRGIIKNYSNKLLHLVEKGVLSSLWKIWGGWVIFLAFRIVPSILWGLTQLRWGLNYDPLLSYRVFSRMAIKTCVFFAFSYNFFLFTRFLSFAI